MPNVIENVKIELTAKDGSLFHQSFVLSGLLADVNTIVYQDRHFGFQRLSVNDDRMVVHFAEVSPPLELDKLLNTSR